MSLKPLALRIYKSLPVFLQRKIVRTLYPGYVVASKVFITNAQGRFLVEETGLKVETMQQFGVIFYPKLRTVQVLFTHQLDSTPDLKADNVEISDLRWVERGEVNLNPYALEAVEVIVDHKAHYWVSKMN